MARRSGALHGVEVTRRETRAGGGKERAAEVLVRRVSVRYEDGTEVVLIPDGRGEFFSRDDGHRTSGMLRQASQTLEWGFVPEGVPDPEQGGGSV